MGLLGIIYSRFSLVAGSIPLVYHPITATENCSDRDSSHFLPFGGRSGGAKVLSKLSVLERPTNLDNNRSRAYFSCSGCGWGLFGHFFYRLSFLFFLLPPWETAR